MNMIIKLGLVCLIIVGSFYFTYHLNSEDKTVQEEQFQHEYVEKVPLYYDLDDPSKIYEYDENKKEFVEVTIE